MEVKKRKTYRNFTRSEKAIIRAYVELMQVKSVSKITVTDIVNTADLNRSTFYAHFKSSEDVLEKIHSDIIAEIIDTMSRDDYRNLLTDPHPVLKRILNFIRRDEEMYKMLLNTEGASKFLKRLEKTVIEQYLSDETIFSQIKDKDEFEMNLRIFIGGFVSVLQDWASDDIQMPLERVLAITEYTIKTCTEIYMKRK